MLEALVLRAEEAGASDIHLQQDGDATRIAFRLDGVLTPVGTLAGASSERVFGRIKYLSRLKTYQASLPQEGRIDRAELGARGDVRVATYPTVTGEKVVLRLFHQGAGRGLAELGLPQPALQELGRFLRSPAGLLLLTGPAGSGKTTTIYACLRHLVSQGGRHIITIEDPAEQTIPGLMQTEVNEALGLTFARAARHLLRQDPQVLVVGEIRDEETATVVARAAMTGHLVISTLHAGSCRGVAERFLGLCGDPQAAAAALSLIVNQRLLRQVCAACAGQGCEACLHSGHRGRIPLAEWCRIDDTIRAHLRRGDPSAVVPPVPLASGAGALIAARRTTQAERDRILGDPL
jgi:type II secretory ATPase GspE/PulE/Tfp pilus assembly ATPase PilB-like protein